MHSSYASFLAFYERLLTKLVVCILAAVLTVSPKRQYRGTLRPTTPAATGPEWIPAIEKSKGIYSYC